SGPPGRGGGKGGPFWLAGAPETQCDALAGALREAGEGCVGWAAAASLAIIALLVGYGFGRLATQRERILLYPVASEAAERGGRGACWVVLSPDMDMYIEELEGGSPDDSPVEWFEVPRDLRLPAGLGRADRFEASPSDADMRGLFRRACSAALADVESRGTVAEPPSTIRNSLGRDIAVEEAPGANFFSGGLVWRAAESDEPSRIVVGDGLGPQAHELCGEGLRRAGPGRAAAVRQTGLGQEAFAASLRGGDVASFSAGASGASGDARALAAKSGARGRGREWREAVGACEGEPFGDFPVAGPRSARWFLDLSRRRRAPTDRRPMFKTTARPQSGQRGAQEHEQLMKWIELARTYDQLDSSNFALAEAIFRRARTIERCCRDRLGEAVSASSKGKMGPDEFSVFSGFSTAGDLLTAAPALLELAKGQVEKDAATMKNIRKVREGRELRRKGPKGGGG
ncbi:unnamed protein product, partial [Prorocentrum cordatum]